MQCQEANFTVMHASEKIKALGQQIKHPSQEPRDKQKKKGKKRKKIKHNKGSIKGKRRHFKNLNPIK